MIRKSRDLQSKGKDDEQVFYQNQVVIKSHNLLKVHVTDNFLADVDDMDLSKIMELENEDIRMFLNKQKEDELELWPLKKLFNLAYKKDPFPAKVLQMLANDMRYLKKVSLANCSNNNKQLQFCEKLWVLNL